MPPLPPLPPLPPTDAAALVGDAISGGGGTTDHMASEGSEGTGDSKRSWTPAQSVSNGGAGVNDVITTRVASFMRPVHASPAGYSSSERNGTSQNGTRRRDRSRSRSRDRMRIAMGIRPHGQERSPHSRRWERSPTEDSKGPANDSDGRAGCAEVQRQQGDAAAPVRLHLLPKAVHVVKVVAHRIERNGNIQILVHFSDRSESWQSTREPLGPSGVTCRRGYLKRHSEDVNRQLFAARSLTVIQPSGHMRDLRKGERHPGCQE